MLWFIINIYNQNFDLDKMKSEITLRLTKQALLFVLFSFMYVQTNHYHAMCNKKN